MRRASRAIFLGVYCLRTLRPQPAKSLQILCVEGVDHDSARPSTRLCLLGFEQDRESREPWIVQQTTERRLAEVTVPDMFMAVDPAPARLL